MLRDGFKNFVTKILTDNYEGSNIEKWQSRLRVLRRKIKGWTKNASACYRKIESEILARCY